jgi:hypothetical protein
VEATIGHGMAVGVADGLGPDAAYATGFGRRVTISKITPTPRDPMKPRLAAIVSLHPVWE